MYISAETLDDLLMRTFKALLRIPGRIHPSRGSATELTGVLLRITNPRARLSRTESRGLLFSCLGELLWYLAGSDSVQFISYYVPQYVKESEDGRTIHGAYGPRLFNLRGINQVRNVLALLKKSDSRRAVIQLFDAADLKRRHKDVPCTCTLQFMVRGRRLHMFTNMRSNDAYLGLAHDIFTFTMLQEIIACKLGIGLGDYKHAVGSLHLYEKHAKRAQRLVDEGWQTTTLSMPPMPPGDPWISIRKVLKIENAIRRNISIDTRRFRLEPYWTDIVLLLKIYRNYKDKRIAQIKQLKMEMSSQVYNTYISKKEKDARLGRVRIKPSQRKLFEEG